LRSPDAELEWTALMTAASDGDASAYSRLLAGITPVIRSTALRTCRRYGAPTGDVEDVVQETLLAIHLKRHTWRNGDPVGPWIRAIAKYKLIDALRKRTRRQEIDIADFVDSLRAEEEADPSSAGDVERLLVHLQARDQTIVRLVSIEGCSSRDVSEKLGMNETAVRVALHRSLKRLAELLRKETK
jgi:RNA polymerase sigma-70 factor (ECF subfamily)